MAAEELPSCLPPEGARAGQAGVVLFRWVSLGHLSATLVDLAARGFVRVEPIPAEAPRDWRLTRQSPAKPAHPEGGLLPYEAALLHGLFASGDQARLSELTNAFTPTLNRARTQLTRDAVRRGAGTRASGRRKVTTCSNKDCDPGRLVRLPQAGRGAACDEQRCAVRAPAPGKPVIRQHCLVSVQGDSRR